MAEPNEQAKNATETSQPNTKPDLPHVESPPLSLADEMKSELIREKIAPPEPIEPMRPLATAPDVKADPGEKHNASARSKLEMPHIKFPRLSLPRFTVSPTVRRTASLAATVMIAAGLGAAFGAAVNKRHEPALAPVQRDAALIEESAAMQKSIARLTRELAALKTSIDVASRDNKENKTQIAKLADRLERAPETTGSIGKQAAAAQPPAAQVIAPAMTEPTPIPQARPPIMQERRPVLQGWTIHEIRNGMAWVEHRGELFAAQPGVPLPGLGTVEAVKREGNQWIVVTAKGVISSAGESTAANVRPRPYYPPYYRPY